MDECATSVILGNTVWAPRENAPLCISPIRLFIGAGRIASGRSPSMEMITTRRAAGIQVGVRVGMGDCVAVGVASVAVGVKVGVGVSVAVGVAVSVGVAVGRRMDTPGALDN